MIESVFVRVLSMSLTAGVIVLAVLLIRLALRRAPRIFSYVLWAAVLFRLLCPVSFTAGFSLVGALQNGMGVQGNLMDGGYILDGMESGGMETGAMTGAEYGGSSQVDLELPVSEDKEMSFPAADSENPAVLVQSFLSTGAAVWVLGMDIMVIGSAVSLIRLRRRLKDAVRDRSVRDQLVGEQDNVYRCRGISTAFVYGILRPRIYLPEGLTDEEKNFVLLHEQAHIRRKDPIWRLLAWTALCIHWFNPLAWLAFALSGRDMEMSCDEAVIARLGSQAKKGYSAALLSLASDRRRLLSGAPLSFSEGGTGGRIRNVLRCRRPGRIAALALAGLCAAAVFFLLANPGADEAQNSEQNGEQNGTELYGVVGYANMEGETLPVVVTVPGVGDMTLPDAEEFVPYMNETADSPQIGDLLRIVFSQEEILIQETYPSRFNERARRVEVLGQGLVLKHAESDVYHLAFPMELAGGAQAGDRLDIRSRSDEAENGAGSAGEQPSGEGLAAAVPVLSVDEINGLVWLELTTEQTKAVLAGYGGGLEITVTEGEAAAPVQYIPADGQAIISVRGLSHDLPGIEKYTTYNNYYTGWDWENNRPQTLYFAQDCLFYVNRSTWGTEYEEITYEEYVEGMEDGSQQLISAPVRVTFQEGEIQEVYVESPAANYGICYDLPMRDDSLEMSEEYLGMSAEEILNTYYTLAYSEQADAANAEGMETISVYTGDAGDGKGGYVVIHGEDGELLCSMYAGWSRVVWNNIYLGKREGTPFLMTVHIEDRYDVGEYQYHVFRLDEKGELMPIAGSSFEFGGEFLYDDEMFHQWAQEMTGWLEDSVLLLSTQDGKLRTGPASDAGRYNYDTLSGSPRRAAQQSE